MASLAPILQRFFTDRMITQRHASQHTIAAYRVLRTWLSEVSTRGW
jgi:integrase/recombinase XerD